MKAIVIYTSVYGSTQKYANYIAEMLECEAVALKDANSRQVCACDTIIYGGGLYAGNIAGFKKFLKLIGDATGKKLVLFAVGNTSPQNRDVIEKVLDANIPAIWRKKFTTFYLRGDQLFSKMSGVHKLMMRMPRAMALKKAPQERSEDDRLFIENFGKDVIFITKEQIEPIVKFCRE